MSDIKPQDLRVNNLVHYLIEDDNEYIPHRIDWQDLKELHEDPKDFNKWHKPIPITEEILLKAGFRPNGSMDERKYWSDLYPITFLNHPNPKTARLICFIHGLSCGHIKHIHELHNLIHVLTGHELTIEL